ncbi:MAG: hypothetical protein IPM17_11805 [Verrucomicrobia bacterium]|nr:hypothetical protein [Verrucomicrobiota bacterium]
MDEPRQGTATYPVPIGSVHDHEAAILEATHAAGRQLHARAFAASPDGWLADNRQGCEPKSTLASASPADYTKGSLASNDN